MHLHSGGGVQNRNAKTICTERTKRTCTKRQDGNERDWIFFLILFNLFCVKQEFFAFFQEWTILAFPYVR